MARTAAGAELTRQHQQQQLTVRAAVIRAVLEVWRLVDPRNLSGTIGPFSTAGARHVRDGNRRSAELAVDYYQAFRRAEGVRGALAVALGAVPELDVMAEALRAAGLSGILRARRKGLTVPVASDHGFVAVSGTATTLTLDGGRDAIIGAVETDPVAIGWQRVVTSARPCAFCAMLASRGPVYRPGGGVSPTGSGITFAAHANCSCTAEPVYEGSEMPARSREFRDLWASTTQGLSGKDALNAFRRALEHGRSDTGQPPTQPPDTGGPSGDA